MKKHKIIFWVTTGLVFLTQGPLELFALQNPDTIKSFVSLGYPEYFVYMLVAFKFVGACVLIIPPLPKFVKEWAYAGFVIDFIAAFVSLWVVGGFNATLLFPVAALVILMISYNSYRKIFN